MSSVTFKRNGAALGGVASGIGGAYVVKDGGAAIMKINSVGPEDYNNYTCDISNKDGSLKNEFTFMPLCTLTLFFAWFSSCRVFLDGIKTGFSYVFSGNNSPITVLTAMTGFKIYQIFTNDQ